LVYSPPEGKANSFIQVQFGNTVFYLMKRWTNQPATVMEPESHQPCARQCLLNDWRTWGEMSIGEGSLNLIKQRHNSRRWSTLRWFSRSNGYKQQQTLSVRNRYLKNRAFLVAYGKFSGKTSVEKNSSAPSNFGNRWHQNWIGKDLTCYFALIRIVRIIILTGKYNWTGNLKRNENKLWTVKQNTWKPVKRRWAKL